MPKKVNNLKSKKESIPKELPPPVAKKAGKATAVKEEKCSPNPKALAPRANKRAKKPNEDEMEASGSENRKVAPPAPKKAKKPPVEEENLAAVPNKFSPLVVLPKLVAASREWVAQAASKMKAMIIDFKDEASKKSMSVAVKDEKGASSSSGPGPWVLEKLRKVRLTEVRGQIMVDIRDHYMKNGEVLPGKMGISLSLDQWKKLVELTPEITRAAEK